MSIYFYGCITLDGYLADKNHNLDWLYQTGTIEETGYDNFYEKMDITIMGRKTFNEILHMENPHLVYHKTENYEKIDFSFVIPENVVLKTPKEIMKLENEKNIFFEFIPVKEKLKIKKLLENGEKIYSDKSIYEIL